MSQLAWLGLGNIGRGMATNLALKASLPTPLLIHNRTASRTASLVAHINTTATTAAGQPSSTLARAADSLAAAVAPSDIVFLCLGDDAAVSATVRQALRDVPDVRGKLFVDASTVHPDTAREMAAVVRERGAEWVSCPVFGAPAMAAAGQLICVPAGPRAAVDRIRPYLDGVVGRATIDFSDQDPGQALLLKLVGNTFVFSMVEALAEGHALAERAGLGAANLHKFLEMMFPGPYVAYSKRMMEGDYFQRDEPLFAVDLALKDARHAKSLAGGQVKLGNLDVAEKHLKMVKEHMGEKGDIAGIYGAVRQEAELPFENH